MNSKLILLCIVLNAYSSLSHRLSYKSLEESLKEVPTENHWVLLVAGSHRYGNYRHQADICRAYHIMRNHGIPAERIITMMYDDIAYNKRNPKQGMIFNEIDGPNVYEGVVIDYKGKDVNPKNFLAILRGDEEAMAGIGSGKVIKSGPNDHVFVNFADHGGPGVICFPHERLYADDLLDTLKEMSADKKFGQMVMYIEACYSGSMFLDLPSNINVYVTTAANDKESSYACTFDESVNAYLGDVFSVNWMADSSKAIFQKETLETQYENVKTLTETSHVMRYGDLKISDETLDNFQGEANFDGVSVQNVPQTSFHDAVPSEDVPLALLYRKLEATKDIMEMKALKREIKMILNERESVVKTVNNIVHRISDKSNIDEEGILNAMHSPKNFDCYKYTSKLFDEKCFDTIGNGYATKQMRKFVNLCEENVPTEIIALAILEECNY